MIHLFENQIKCLSFLVSQARARPEHSAGNLQSRFWSYGKRPPNRQVLDQSEKLICKMDFDTQRKKRMEALEDKRRRLEEMRKMRKDRTEPTEEIQENQQVLVDERTQVDNLVNSLLISSINEPESITATDSMSPRYFRNRLPSNAFPSTHNIWYYQCQSKERRCLQR